MVTKIGRTIGIAVLLAVLNAPVCVQAQVDTVITRSESSNKTAKRRGEIVSWTGSALTMKSGSRTREIDNERIVEIRTNWNPDYLLGKKLLAKGQAAEAIEKLRLAVNDEKREWAQSIARSELVRALIAFEDNAAAIEEFALMIKVDPQTRFVNLIPLPWAGSVGDARVQKLAKQALDSQEPLMQLIGASWLTGGSDRAIAIQRLEKLAKDFEPRIANLATAQLWRTQVGTADETKVANWEQQILQMPKPLRAGPYYVLALAQSSLNQNDKAAINWMRIPILFPQQNGLSAAALYKCAKLLQNDDQTEQARTLWLELVSDYPESSWAKQVDSNFLKQRNN